MNPIVRRNHLTYIKSGRGASWRPPEADVFPRPAPRRCFFFFLCVLFVFANIQQIGIDGFIPPQLQLIVCNHHHPQEAPKHQTRVSMLTPGECFTDGSTSQARGLHGCQLENNLDKLRARITTQREVRACCSLIFTETWLSDKVPECTVQLQTYSTQGDQIAVQTKRGGMFVFINNSWCGDIRTVHDWLLFTFPP